MIRYEIVSNSANSEQGLQPHPALRDLVDTLRAHDIDARVVRQSFREEGEVNLASSRHARGVTVRGTAVRTLPPESHIKGCLGWLRAVSLRPDRALHVAVEKVRATNGAPLLFPALQSRQQHVFVTGLADGDWRRLIARPDRSGAAVPPEVAGDPALRQDYQERSRRPASFLALVQRLAELKVVEPALHKVLQRLLAEREAALSALTEAQAVNIGLIGEALERCEKLVEQFVVLVTHEPLLGDLPVQFDLLTRGLPAKVLIDRLSPYALEEKRARIGNVRTLVNEVRIGLQHADESAQQDFRRDLLSLVLRRRVEADPEAWRQAHRLPPQDPALVEALETARAGFRAWQEAAGAAGEPQQPDAPVPAEVAQGLFEFAVTMVFQAKFQQSYADGQPQPAAVVLARNLMSAFVFERFDIARLRNLHPALPPRGVAKNLAEKVHPTWAEVARIRADVWNALYPHGRLAAELRQRFREREHTETQERRTRELEAFLLGSPPLLRASAFIVGAAGQSGLMHAAMLAAGRALGLDVYPTADALMAHRASRDPGEPQGAGHVSVLQGEGRLFPLGTAPAHLAAAYRELLEAHVVDAVRRSVAGKLNFLVNQHGSRTFDVLYNLVVWEHHLRLSREQLAAILLGHHLFDRARLRELGYVPGTEVHGNELRNVWLTAAAAPAAERDRAFASGAVEKAYGATLHGFEEILESHGAGPRGNGTPTVAEALAGLKREGVLDLTTERSRAALNQTREAGQLTRLLGALLRDTPAAGPEDEGAGEASEYVLGGPLAFLALLRDRHRLGPAGDGEPPRPEVRLRPGRHLNPRELPGPSRALTARLSDALSRNPAAADLRAAVERMQRHHTAWRQLVQLSGVVLADKLLGATTQRMIQPQPPLPEDIARLPEETVLCLGTSSSDQSRFHHLVGHPERRDVFATLSELASWLYRFPRLEDELQGYRAILADILEIIAGFNLSAFDAPHVNQYVAELKALDGVLDVRAEDVSAGDLARIEAQATAVGRMVREAFEAERELMLRDRWFSRLSMRLRGMRPNVRLTFVDLLHERSHPAGGEASGEGPGQREEEYQTFSERVRNVVDFKTRMAGKQVFVLAPNNTQRRLTMMLVDQLYRLKGLDAAIFADVSGCQSFVDVLRTRIPPHRLFDLTAL